MPRSFLGGLRLPWMSGGAGAGAGAGGNDGSTPVGGLFYASDASVTVAEGHRHAFRIDADGYILIKSGGAASTDTELPTAAALADNAANPTTPMIGANLMVWDGATWDRGASLAVVGSGVITASTLRVDLATDSLIVPDADAIRVATEAAQVALEIMDDWDEVNRAAVNLIAGQVAVAGGSGINGATVLRATIATDDEINDDLDAIAVDAAAIEALAITIDADTGAILVDTNALVVDAAASEALLITIDADTGGILLDTADIEVATEAIQVSAAAIDADTSSILADTTAILADTATIDVNVADIEALATTIDADTGAILLDTADIEIAVETLEDAVHAEGAAFVSALAIAGIDSANNAQPLQVNGNDELLIHADGVAVLGSDFVATDADQQAVAATPGLRLRYVTFEETAGAVANIIVRHGTLATDEALLHIRLAANESRSEWFPDGGIDCPDGVFLDRVSGTYSANVGTQVRGD